MGVSWVTISPKEQAHSVTLSLTESSYMHGRILQPDGQGAARVPVQLVRLESNPGRRWLLVNAIVDDDQRNYRFEIATDDQGNYRFEVDPGDYYLRTLARVTEKNSRVYYPGTADPGKATPISVSPGEDVNADIHLTTDPLFKISIRLIDNLSDRGGHYVSGFYLLDRNATVQEMEYLPSGCTCPPSGPDVVRADFVTVSSDRFEIHGVRPGSYDLVATMLVGDLKPGEFWFGKIGDPLPYSRTYEGHASLDVKNSNVENVQIEIRPGVDVQGRITLAGKSSPVKEASVHLTKRGGRPFWDLAETDKSGRFRFPNLPVGIYDLSFGFLGRLESYVVDVRQNGSSIYGSEINIDGSRVEPIEVLVSPDGGMIDGVVRDSNSARLIVVLLPEPQENRARFIKKEVTNPAGNFKVSGVAPGGYRVLAIDETTFAVDFDQSHPEEFIARYWSRAQPVTVPSKRTIKVILSRLK
jgi:5-hydroxyisourate hydrolase-like protein (transthyretin family)